MIENVTLILSRLELICANTIFKNFDISVVYFFIFVYISSLLLFILTVTYIIGNFSYNSFKFIRHLKFFKTFFSLNLINLASLIGIPPLAGFVAKFFLLNNINLTNNPLITFSFFCLLILSLTVYFQLLKQFKNFIKPTELDLIATSGLKKYRIMVICTICIILVILNIFFFKDLILFLLLNA
jgi:NADH:ubiquinone oxidoreductase subunit 2 (subunit N)